MARSAMPGAATLLWRGLTKRCPWCGRGKLFRRWFSMPKRCPRCGLFLEREEASFLGAMTVNLAVTEAIFGVLVVVWFALTLPDVPVLEMVLTGLAVNATVPLVFYPFSKTIWVALDLLLHKMDVQDRAAAEVTFGVSWPEGDRQQRDTTA